MTITYDAEGKCTQCGSTGHYLSSYTSDSSFEDTRACIKPCPCHGWRPIERAPKDRTKVDVCGPRLEPVTVHWSADSERWLMGGGYRVPRGGVTHFRPRPQPPEES